MVAVWFSRLKLPIVLVLLQVLFIAMFAILVDYDVSASPTPLEKHSTGNSSGGDGGDGGGAASHGADEMIKLHHYYPMFQDVHVMIFIGFGFLMMFLRRYGFSSVGLNMLLAAIAIQWSMLIGGLVHHKGESFHISIVTMLTADFASASVLITFGALLGKTSPMQMVVITLVEIALFSVNEYIGVVLLKAVDIGGSMFVHAFGAYFGLALSRVLYSPDVAKSSKEGSVYHSDMFAVVGSVFLWMFWPSFNSALALEDAQARAVLNTYLALAACCLLTFAISSLVDKAGKLDMVHIQNATLAGGVAVGTSADMMIQPYGALIIGSLAGLLSVIGYKFITPFLSTRLKIHDTCGVNNLHGMPAILAGVTGAIVVALADKDTYGYSLYRQFPAMAPNASSPEWAELAGHVDVEPSDGRSAGKQAAYQLLALGVTLALALVGGLAVGLLLKVCSFLGQPSGNRLFEDSPTWHVPDDPENDALVSSVLVEFERRQTSPNKFTQESGAPLLVGDVSRGEITARNGDNQV